MDFTKKFNIGLTLILICILLSACGPSPEELTATAAAETAAAATNTPIPPTSTPNPDAEKIIMEFSEMFNNQEIEAALALFTEDANIGGDLSPVKGKDQIEIWLKVNINTLKTSYKFSEVNVEGNEVIWNVIVHDFSGKERCEFNATIQDGLISSLRFRECVDIN